MLVIIMAWRILTNYIKGNHSGMTREVLFAIVDLVFIFDLSTIGTIIQWAGGVIHDCKKGRGTVEKKR